MTINLGKITLNNTVFVSDPSYSINVWCTHTIHNMLPGKYHATAKKIDAGEFGKRIASLTITHENYISKNLNFENVENAEIGVDSGCAGFWDYNEYKLLKRCTKERDDFDNLCYNACFNKKGGGTIGHWGVVTKSGYGDGGYPLKVAYDKEHKNIIAATIDYILEE